MLRRGDLVAIPTETVYGLAADALNAAACRKIFRAKRRPPTDPLIVHVLDLDDAAKIAEISPEARKLANAFWPGPLTLVLPKKSIVPDIVTSGRNSVAVRSPVHPLARKILKLCGRPLAAPSANPFSYISPTSADHVREGLGFEIRHILDGGPSQIGVESTIVSLLVPSKPRILRLGAISQAAIAEALGRHTTCLKGRPNQKTKPLGGEVAPGMLPQHYSPRTPLRLFGKIESVKKRPLSIGTGLIYFQKPTTSHDGANCFWLSANGDINEAARNLYAVLRKADKAGFSRLWIERAPVSSGSLAEAINDRLKRASFRG